MGLLEFFSQIGNYMALCIVISDEWITPLFLAHRHPPRDGSPL
jgi:hypothetical protein